MPAAEPGVRGPLAEPGLRQRPRSEHDDVVLGLWSTPVVR